MKQDCADGDAVHQAVQCVVSALPQFDAVLADCGERGRGVGSSGDIVKSDDADITRHLISKLAALCERGAGECVLTADYGGHAHVKKTRQMLLHTFRQIVGTP